MAGEGADGDRHVGRPVDGRAGLGNGFAGHRRHDGKAGDVGGLALVGRHAERRVALEMLDRFKALALRQLDVGGGDVVLQVDEGLALAGDMPERRQRERLVVGDRRRSGIAGAARISAPRRAGRQSLRAGRRRARSRRWRCPRPPCRAARHPARRRRCRRAISAGRDGMRSGRPPGSSRRKRQARRPRPRRARCRPATTAILLDAILAAVDAADGAMQHGEACLEASERWAGEISGARIDDRGDLQSGFERRLDRAPAILIVGEQRDAPCRRRGIALDVCPHRRSHHHAGRVVAGETRSAARWRRPRRRSAWPRSATAAAAPGVPAVRADGR